MQTQTRRYNGWTNYETWLAYTWISNEDSSNRYWQERARELNEENGNDVDETERQLAEYLEIWLNDEIVEVLPEDGLLNDLLTSAASEIDWREIAEHIADENATDCEDE